MTLFQDQTGPLLQYEAGVLHIEDLNPQVKTQWRMKRVEMFSLAWRCLVAAIKG